MVWIDHGPFIQKNSSAAICSEIVKPFTMSTWKAAGRNGERKEPRDVIPTKKIDWK
jgi:hypothetical protein